MTLTFKLLRAIVTEILHTKFQVPVFNCSGFRASTNKHTDGSDCITLTGDAGVKKLVIKMFEARDVLSIKEHIHIFQGKPKATDILSSIILIFQERKTFWDIYE